jgi:hypothetical protein
LGQINSDRYALTLKYDSTNHRKSEIINCAFVNGYNVGIRATSAQNLIASGNVIYGAASWSL